jgi:hypothetical protein
VQELDLCYCEYAKDIMPILYYFFKVCEQTLLFQVLKMQFIRERECNIVDMMLNMDMDQVNKRESNIVDA